MTNTISDITIIGGGIIGLLSAREFLKAGLTVTVIEKNICGKESSWAGGGILLPLYPWKQDKAITDLVIQSLKLYPQLMYELFLNTGIDPEYLFSGLLITQNDTIDEPINWCNQNNIPFQLPYDTLFDELNAQVKNPLWLPTITQTRNPRLLKAVQQDILDKGCRLIEQAELTEIAIRDNIITTINTTAGSFAINELLIATGAWTTQLLKNLFSNIQIPNIKPARGQMLVFDTPVNTLTKIILEGDKYLIPRRDGKILAGSTVEYDDFNKITTHQAKIALQHFALNLMPKLKEYPLLYHWAGLRPATEQGIPYISKHPEIDNLSINAGHFRNGLVMSVASAQLIVDLILNRPTAINPNSYQLSLF